MCFQELFLLFFRLLWDGLVHRIRFWAGIRRSFLYMTGFYKILNLILLDWFHIGFSFLFDVLFHVPEINHGKKHETAQFFEFWVIKSNLIYTSTSWFSFIKEKNEVSNVKAFGILQIRWIATRPVWNLDFINLKVHYRYLNISVFLDNK